jgi:DNA-binding transcriptional LysR family regulator
MASDGTSFNGRLKMETLANLTSFVRTAETGSFSAAARRLGLTAAAVSRNVGILERNLGVRLFHRSTRKLTLTERGARFLGEIDGSLTALQAAIAGAGAAQGEPAGVLKVSVSPIFGMRWVLPLLPEFRRRHPKIRVEWHFENRQVDLRSDGLDVAIGGGLDLSASLVARTLAPAHLIAVAAPGYLRDRPVPAAPADLIHLDGIAMRSVRTGRLVRSVMTNGRGREAAATFEPRVVVNDPAALGEAARLGLGVALVALPDVLPELESGSLVRLLRAWYVDAGRYQVYYDGGALAPGKNRVFVDFVASAFREARLARRFGARAAPARAGSVPPERL